jgi:hypothetical protein
MKDYFSFVSRDSKAVPGAAIAIQTFGDFLGFNPHLHVLISDSCFHESGMLTIAHRIDCRTLERLFRHRVLKMLLKKGKITWDMNVQFRKNWSRLIQKIYPVEFPEGNPIQPGK